MTGARRVETEWLDELPAGDPRAVHARRDLERINTIMLQPRIMARLLGRTSEVPPRTLIDIGCGDGGFALRVAKAIGSHWRGVHVVLLDRQDIVPPTTKRRFAELHWTVETVSGDAADYLGQLSPRPMTAIMANLFLHHFADAALAALLARIAATSALFVACEPRRAAHAVAATRLLWAIGCNDLTRHDAAVSVRAGFRRTELSDLWPKGVDWTLREHSAALFTHCFAARRNRVPA